MAQAVVLCHASVSAAEVARYDPTQWVFLGEDYVRQLEWRDGLGPDIEQIDPGPWLRDAAARLRRPFLDAITALGRRHDSLAWWTSRLSERNTMVSPLFLHCCYLAVGEQVLDHGVGTVCIVSQSRAVLESLAANAGERHMRVERVGSTAVASSWFRATARAARFVGWWMRRRLDAPARTRSARRPLVLLRTWVDAACFDRDGGFHDRYFDGLASWIGDRGSSVAVIPVLYNMGCSDREAWRKLRAAGLRIVPLYSYARLTDVMFVLRVARRQATLPDAPVTLDGGLDVSRLFREERKRAAFEGGSLDAILWHRLPRRLARRGWRPDVFIDAFENHVDEKALNLGFREALPATKIVGFQHGALSPLLISNFVTAGEADIAPVPDRVVCNGEDFRDILVGEGLPAERAVVGAALRYRHLWEARTTESGSAVLVALPLELQAGVEVLVKVLQTFGDVDDMHVLLKPHPMASVDKLFSAARVRELPAHVQVVGGPMAECLSRAGVLLSLASSTLHEALAAGVPVVVVGRDSALDLNPLAWYPDLASVFSAPAAIRAETMRLLALHPDERAAYRRRGAEILRRSFNPVNDQTMGAFVDGLLSLHD